MLNNKKYILYTIIIIILFSIDRISKLYILNIAQTSGQVDIYINSFLNFILIWNTGIGFGLFSVNETFSYNILTFLIIIINFIILYYAVKSNNITSYFFIMVLGGSLGNLFDRIYYSAVPDFIDINYNGYHWFIFNVADIFITTGIFCLIIVELLGYKRK